MVQKREAGAPPSQEGPKNRYHSNFHRIARHFVYNPDFKSVGRYPLLDTINEYGAQDGNFFVAPVKPEFSVKRLSEIQRKLAYELGLAVYPDSMPVEKEGDGMQFGIIRTKDPLFHMTRRTVVTELEEGTAQIIGSKDEETKEFSGTIERMVFVRLYPHIVLAEIARYAAENKKFGGQPYYYLGGLIHSIKGEQLALLRRLSEKGLSWYEIKDALIAKELERDINEIARNHRRNITVGSRVSIDF